MTTRRTTFFPLLLCVLAGCPGDDADDDAADHHADDDAASSSASADDGGTSSAGVDDGSESGDDGGTSSAGVDEGSDSAASSDSGELCAAVEGDDACIACAKAMCCDAYAACYGDPDCVCAVECILETMDYETCLGPMCNMPDAAPAMDIGICYGTTCAGECGFG